MSCINLRKIIHKNELLATINSVTDALDCSITIWDEQEKVILGKSPQLESDRFPIKVADDIVIGWIGGGQGAQIVANILSHIANCELERKNLAIETLNQYEEINFLYEISSKIASRLGTHEIASFVLDESCKLIRATSASVMLFNADSGNLEIIATLGRKATQLTIMQPGIGIAGHVFLSGKAEIVNDVHADPRYIQGLNVTHALICTPLTTYNGTIGVINMSHAEPISYTSHDLKLLTTLTAQAAAAIENALLHEQNLQQEKDKNKELELRVEQRTVELKEAKEAADEASKIKSEFLAHISHELRTPLNAILGFTQLMEHDLALKPEQREYLGIINHSGEHLLALVNNVLEMSKIEAGRTTVHQKSFDLHNLLQDLEEMLRLNIQSKELQFIINIAPNTPQYIRTDELKLRQILINLLGNAIKFTEKGSITLGVSAGGQLEKKIGGQRSAVSSQQEEEKAESRKLIADSSSNTYLHFKIEDTGTGITPQDIDRLFEAFIQSDSGIKSQQGTGLGLSISRHFVQLMGGDIAVSSTLGEGTTFSFDIFVEIAKANEVKVEHVSQVIGLEPQQPTYRILVVDDIWENRKLLVQLLSPLGFEVEEAEDGMEAIALWQSWQPHLIWMDIRMPVMNGQEATQKIREQESTQDSKTKIIALTASAFEETRTSVLAYGFDDFVSKPIQEQIVFDKMVQYLGVRYICSNPVCTLPETSPETPLNTVDANEDSENLNSQKSVSQSLRILLAEDNFLNQKLVLKMLDSMGYQADLACNGQEVLEALSHRPYDVIFMDVEMPVMDGLETTRCIRAMEKDHAVKLQDPDSANQPIKIIAITGNALEGDRENCLDTGMDDYICKPIRLAELSAALSKCVG